MQNSTANPIMHLIFKIASLFEKKRKGRNINRLSIFQYPSVLKLGPPNPWMIIIAKEILGFRCAPLSDALRLLMPTFSPPIAPPNLTI